MASTVVVAEVQDDEAWLYGETPEKKDGAEASEEPPVPGEGAAVSTLSASATPFQPGEKKMEEEGKEAGELSGEETENKTENANEEDDDDDDDSDDDVQVTIGDIKTQTAYDAPMFKSGYGRAGVGPVTPKPQTKGIDLDAPGNINGVSVYEFDISSLKDEERPWRKPGADITDYFNYGFNEETWAKYGEKQRRLRMENCSKPHSGGSKSSQPRSENTTETTDSTIPSPGGAAGRRAGPPPGRKMAGTIDVIGGSTADSRRPQQDFRDHLTSSEAQDYKKYPPPGLPGPIPTHLPPPDYAVPPPGTMPPPPNPLPPPMVPPPPQGIAPPGLSGPPPNFAVPPNFFPPGPSAPPMSRVGPPGYGDRPPYSFDNFGPPPTFRAPPTVPPPNWDSRPDNFNRSWEFPHDQRSPTRSESDFSSDDDAEIQSSYSNRRGGRENRDGRDIRSGRDGRSGHESRDVRDGRDNRDIREVRESRERYDPFDRSYQSRRERSVSHDRDRDRELRDREPREPRDREPRDREPRDRDREPRDRELRDRTPRRHVKDFEHDDRRDDRHRSRSRRHHDTEDHHSKHKKSKRTKHDNDQPTETPPVAQIETTAAS